MATWGECVTAMANFYQNNIHTYQGHSKGQKTPVKTNAWVSCPLLNVGVRDDCSGFVSACLQLAGVFPKGTLTSSLGFSSTTGTIADLLKRGGFQPIPYSEAALQPGDIYSGNNGQFHHVEICAGKGKTYSWGNVHDVANGGMPSGIARGAYTVIWRLGANAGDFNIANGGAGSVTYKYDVPRNEQQDNILIEVLSELKLELLKETLEFADILFDEDAFKSKHNISDLIQNDEKQIKILNTSNSIWQINDKITKFYNKGKTESNIIRFTPYKKSDDLIKYNNTMAKEEDNGDASISEGITNKAIEMGLLPAGFGGNGDAAIAFGDLYELSDSEANKYLSGDTLARAKQAIALLMKYGLTKIAACTSVGVFLSENHCKPDSKCEKEAAGGGTAYTKDGGYGAGIASWTGVEHKANCLKLLGLPASTKIESLSMEQQCKMYALEVLSKAGKTTYDKMLNGTLEESSVAAMFKTHGDARDTLRQYGYTYKAAYEEQLLQTQRLMKFAGRSTPSVHHQTGLLVRILLGGKLMDMV